jgi:activator of HSP90 ATPase
MIIVCKLDHILQFFYVPHKTATLEGGMVDLKQSKHNSHHTTGTQKSNHGFQHDSAVLSTNVSRQTYATKAKLTSSSSSPKKQ